MLAHFRLKLEQDGGLAGDLLGMKNSGALFMGVLRSRMSWITS